MAFATNIAKFMKDEAIYGVVFDWEYPKVCKYPIYNYPRSKGNNLLYWPQRYIPGKSKTELGFHQACIVDPKNVTTCHSYG